MTPALALQLLPLLTPLVQTITDIFSAIRDDPGTPDEVKAKLEEIVMDLDATVQRVKDAPLPNA